MTEFLSGSLFFIVIIICILSLVQIISIWKVFVKTGRKGFISLIPIYNMWEFFVISDLKGWFSLVPVANILMCFFAYYKLAILFGKSNMFAIFNVIMPFIGLPILAFGNSSYNGYIEEGRANNYNFDEPVYTSDKDEVSEILLEESDTTQYKVVKNTNLNDTFVSDNNKLVDPLVDYGLKMDSTEIPDPEPQPEIKQKKFIVPNEDDDLEVVDL